MRVNHMSLGLHIKNCIFVMCVALVVLCQGCLPEYYPGSYSSPVLPVISQLDTQKGHGKYIGLDAGYTRRWNEEEKNYMLRLNYILATSGKYSSFNFGFSGYSGMYEVVQVAEYKGSYNYIGGGVQLGGNLHLPIKKVDVGIGLYFNIGFEGGDYYSFRKKSDDAGLAVNNTEYVYLLVAAQPLMINYRFTERDLLSIQCNATSSLSLTANILYQRNRSCLWLGWTHSPYKDIDPYKYGSFTLGVMYSYN